MKGKTTPKPGRKPGAKAKAAGPDKATRDLVAIAAGGGTPAADIATALGIDLSTLLRDFRKELSTGAFEKRVRLVQSLYAQALKGNTGAAKAYLAMQPAIVAAPSSAGTKPEAQGAKPAVEEKPPKPIKLGKKEQQKAAARTAQTGSPWASVLPDHSQTQQ